MLADALQKEMREVDADMEGFILLDPDFYATYQKVRQIIDTGSRPGPDAGDAPA